MPDPILFAVIAAAFGPWVAALWQTGGYTKSGSSPYLRFAVKSAFWGCLAAAVALEVARLA